MTISLFDKCQTRKDSGKPNELQEAQLSQRDRASARRAMLVEVCQQLHEKSYL